MSYHVETVRPSNSKLVFSSTISTWRCDSTSCDKKPVPAGPEGPAGDPPKGWMPVRFKGENYHGCCKACRLQVLAMLQERKKGPDQ